MAKRTTTKKNTADSEARAPGTPKVHRCPTCGNTDDDFQDLHKVADLHRSDVLANGEVYHVLHRQYVKCSCSQVSVRVTYSRDGVLVVDTE